jgi:hypothetical protein
MTVYKVIHYETPLPPYWAKFYTDRLGGEALFEERLEFSEAEADFGSDWVFS